MGALSGLDEGLVDHSLALKVQEGLLCSRTYRAGKQKSEETL